MWIFLPHLYDFTSSIHSEDFYELSRFQAADHLYSLGPPRLRCPHHCFRHSQNNDTHLDGLTILAPGQNLAPTIYLDYYYGQYERGRSFSDITDDILTAYRENRPKSPVDISFFTDYDKVKSRVTMKLINYERNRELLKQVPYYRFWISPSSSYAWWNLILPAQQRSRSTMNTSLTGDYQRRPLRPRHGKHTAAAPL